MIWTSGHWFQLIRPQIDAPLFPRKVGKNRFSTDSATRLEITLILRKSGTIISYFCPIAGTKTFTSILLFLLLFVATHSMAQTSDLVRVAILETVDKEGNDDYAKEVLLRQTLTIAINRTQGYEGYNRVDMKQITGEHNFQRTGMVSDDYPKGYIDRI